MISRTVYVHQDDASFLLDLPFGVELAGDSRGLIELRVHLEETDPLLADAVTDGGRLQYDSDDHLGLQFTGVVPL